MYNTGTEVKLIQQYTSFFEEYSLNELTLEIEEEDGDEDA